MTAVLPGTESGLATAPSTGRIVLRTFAAGDRASVAGLLALSRQLYPGFDDWLARRLDAVLAGEARGVVAVDGQAVIGVCLSLAKPGGKYKISSLAVAPTHEHRGIDVDLLADAVQVAAAQRLIAYMTVASSAPEDLKQLLYRFGFGMLAKRPDLYGTGRDEYIFARDRF